MGKGQLRMKTDEQTWTEPRTDGHWKRLTDTNERLKGTEAENQAQRKTQRRWQRLTDGQTGSDAKCQRDRQI